MYKFIGKLLPLYEVCLIIYAIDYNKYSLFAMAENVGLCSEKGTF